MGLVASPGQPFHETTLPRYQATETWKGHVRLCGDNSDRDDGLYLHFLFKYAWE